ncbi:MAG: hypothetical protein PHY92_01550 [Alphaproteobacteria bacterium]|nr:hypothetical protein [Alphaproteobacteria bacterium]
MMMPLLLFRRKDKPALDLSFLGGMPSGLTFSRASAGWCFDDTGALQQAATDAPRFDYDPGTHDIKGLLLEEQRTNTIGNNTMQGASTSPSTLPSSWAVETSNALTTTVAGLGTEYGMPYVDLRISGTASGITYQLRCDYGTPAANGQIWAASAYVKKVGGTAAGVDYPAIKVREMGGAYSSTDSAHIDLTTTGLARYTATRAWTTSYNAQWLFYLRTLGAGSVIDITLRFYAPQLEQGPYASSPIMTTSGSPVTRAADLLGTTNIQWFNAVSGTFASEHIPEGVTPASNNPRVLTFGDGTADNMIALRQVGGATNYYGGYALNATALVVDTYNVAPQTAVAAGSAAKMAMRYAANDAAVSTNGNAAQADTSCAFPAVTRLDFFRSGTGTNTNSGWLRRFRYWNAALTNAQLQQVTQ